MFKQDTVLTDNPDNQIWVKTDNDTASINLVDPSTVNLFSNLDQASMLSTFYARNLQL